MVIGIDSEAFRRATLRSDRIRILILLGTFGAFLLILVIRILTVRDPEEIAVFPNTAALLGVMGMFEALSLALVNRTIRAGGDLPSWAGVVNLSVEALFPTLALVILTHSSIVGPYKALVTPTAAVYFVFIILSILRLTPMLSWLTGLASSAGYLAVMVHTYWEFPSGSHLGAVFPAQTYVTYAGLILTAGFAAGAVSRQVRLHVLAAVREVETRKEVERMQHDLSVARSIQQRLLPSDSPEIDGFEFAGWNQPAEETGGDYFDWQKLPSGSIAISLADVTGHGIGPALVTTSCRAYARACFPLDEDLSRAMALMNRALVEDLPPDRFVTYVSALLEPDRSRVYVVSAGHGPILFYKAAEDRFQIYDSQGVPLGLLPEASYGLPHVIQMEPGDTLALVTDGFWEWTNPEGEEYGSVRLQETLRAARDLAPGAMIQALCRGVTDFAQGTEQLDDLTAVILKKRIH